MNTIPSILSFRLPFILSFLFINIYFIFGSATSAFAQHGNASITGRVLERDSKKSLSHVTVTLLPYNILTTTKADGSFEFSKLQPGKVQLKIEHLGMETIDTTIILEPGINHNPAYHMSRTSFWLNEVTVVAKEKTSGLSTSSKISRTTLDHMQMVSLGNIMQLLPGGTVANPSLSNARENAITIRSISSNDYMNSLGTSIIVDGSAISNNANMQALNTAIGGNNASVGGGSGPSSGIDLRAISTDDIESIEVIRGIPSVEYGDLTAGAIIVKTKSGVEPWNIRFKTNPNIYQASVGKGFLLSEKAGTLNVSADYAYNTNNLTESYAYYQRATGKILYSNTFFNKLSSTTSFNFSFGKDTRRQNPDDHLSQLSTSARDISLRLNTNGTYRLNKEWLKSIEYTLSGNYTNKHSMNQQLFGNAFATYSTALSDGTIISNIPGLKIYDNDGNEITNIPKGEEKSFVTVLPNEYFHRSDIYGKEINTFAKLKFNFANKIGNKIFNRTIAGADFRSEGNIGAGLVYDLANPPYRTLSSKNSSPRPRPFKDVPFINQAGLYIEDIIKLNAGKRDIDISAGIRYDYINSKSAWQPRINASVELIPRLMFIRGGYGITAKMPTILHLYPNDAYFDFANYNTLNSSTTPDNEKLMIGTTYRFDAGNSRLQIATNQKKELGIDFNISKKMRFSITGYHEKQNNGYVFAADLNSYKLIPYTTYKIAQQNAGAIPTLMKDITENVFVHFNKPTNGQTNINKGVEFDFDLGRFDNIRTAFVISGAWMRSSSYYNGATFNNASNGNELSTNIGIYAPAKSTSEREMANTTLRITHNIPKIGFVATLSTQLIFCYKYWSTYGNDSMFVSYISRKDGKVYPFDQKLKDDPEFSYLFATKPNHIDAITESFQPTLMFNLNLTKEIGDYLRISFFANNMFSSRPLYNSKRTPGTFTELGIPLFFGIDLTATIK